MLSEAEVRKLTEIEAEFRRKDPMLVRQFGDFARLVSLQRRSRKRVFIGLLVGALLIAFAVLIKSPLLVLAGVSAVAVALTWWAVPAEVAERRAADPMGSSRWMRKRSWIS